MADPIVFPGAQEQNYSEMIDALKRAGKYAAPNLYGLFSGAPQPPLPNIPQNPATGEAIPGKVPSTSDPRVPSAILEEANLAANAVPFAFGGPAAGGARAVGGALREGARAMNPNALGAGAAAATGLLTSPDTAEAQRLNKDQQRQLLMQKQQADIETAAAAAREKAKADALAEAKRQEVLTQGKESDRLRAQKLDDAEAERVRLEAAAEAERVRKAEAAQKELDKSWRLTNPEASKALSAAGWAGAGLLPYAGRTVSQWAKNRPIANWENTIDKAHASLREGDVAAAKAFGADALGFKKDYAANLKNAAEQGIMSKMLKGVGKAAGIGASAALPVELGMYPEWQDLQSGTPKAKENAWADVPEQLPFRALQGLTGYALGGHLPTIQDRLPPDARTNALTNLLKGARNPSVPKVAPAPTPLTLVPQATAPVVAPKPKRTRAKKT